MVTLFIHNIIYSDSDENLFNIVHSFFVVFFFFYCQISFTSTRIFDAQKKIAVIQMQTLVWVHTIVQK